MNRFFFDKDTIIYDTVALEGDDVQHIIKVLRFEIGDKIILCDGAGFDYLCIINSIEKNTINFSILEKNKALSEPEIEITLFQGIPKGEKMELIIQKCVELGVNKIVPVSMTRCVVKIDNEKEGKKKQERWQKIAREAAKQCGRGIIPEVTLPLNFKSALEKSRETALRILPYEKEYDKENGLKNVLKSALKENKNLKSAAILIGPEGGFDLKEVDMAIDSGFKTITLGKRILRTETAGFVAISCLMYESEEM